MLPRRTQRGFTTLDYTVMITAIVVVVFWNPTLLRLALDGLDGFLHLLGHIVK